MPQSVINKYTKVLFVTRKWPPALGGMETYSKQLTEELEQKVDLEILALKGNSNGSPPSYFTLSLFFIKSAGFLFKKRNQFDVIHFGDLVLFPLAWIDSKFSSQHIRILTVHGLDIIYGNRKGLVPKIYQLFIYFVACNLDSVDDFISNSRNTASLANTKRISPVVSIPLGVTIEHYKTLKVPPENNPDKYLFFFGRTIKRKGLSWFLKNVMPKLPEDIILLAAGVIWDEKEIKEFPENRFHHLGIISDELLTYYCRHSLAVVVPNLTNPIQHDVEGFGLVTLDAAARGAVVLASAIEGINDAVIDGQTGFLLPAECPAAWINKIQEINEWSLREKKQFINHSKQVIKTEFSWKRVANDTLEVYRKFLQQKKLFLKSEKNI